MMKKAGSIALIYLSFLLNTLTLQMCKKILHFSQMCNKFLHFLMLSQYAIISRFYRISTNLLQNSFNFKHKTRSILTEIDRPLLVYYIDLIHPAKYKR